jgi:hypothetical protein
LKIFELARTRFKEVTDHGGRFWIPEASLGLGLGQDRYHGQERLWLRWFDAQGQWIPTPEEQAEHERKQKDAALLREAHLRQRAEAAEQVAEQERQRAEQERQRAERLGELLRQLGHDPDKME